MPKPTAPPRSAAALRARPRAAARRSRLDDPKRARAAIANDDWNAALSDAGEAADPNDDSGLVGEQEQPATQAALAVDHPDAPRIPRFAPPPPAPVAPALTLRPCTNADYDRLWDWVRDDPDGALRSFGYVPEFSRALFEYLDRLITLESAAVPQARIRSVYLADSHIGLVRLVPIERGGAHPHAYAHCFLAPQAKGHLPQLLPLMLDEAATMEPSLTLRVFAHDYAFARLLEPHGFKTEIYLTRPPATTRA